MTTHEGHRQRLRRRFLLEGLDNFDEVQVLELLLFMPYPAGIPIPLPTLCWSSLAPCPVCWRLPSLPWPRFPVWGRMEPPCSSW